MTDRVALYCLPQPAMFQFKNRKVHMQRLFHLRSLFTLSFYCFTLLAPAASLAQSHEQADHYRQLAQAMIKQKRTLEAARMYEKSALAEQRSPEPRQENLAITLSRAGYYFYQAGKYDKSTELHQQSLEISRKLDHKEGIASGLANIGIVYKTWGQFDKAIEFYQQALQMLRNIGDENGAATLLNNIGAVYEARSQYDKAADFYQQALEIASQEHEDSEKRIRALRNRLERGILEQIPEVRINGKDAPRLPNTSNVSIHYVEGEGMLYQLSAEGICASR